MISVLGTFSMINSLLTVYYFIISIIYITILKKSHSLFQEKTCEMQSHKQQSDEFWL
jgi:hypothetical protein